MLRSNSDEYQADITITQARYNELIIAEHEAKLLKALISEKAESYDSLTNLEIRLIDSSFNRELSEDSERH